jgi:hypothetical protein
MVRHGPLSLEWQYDEEEVHREQVHVTMTETGEHKHVASRRG